MEALSSAALIGQCYKGMLQFLDLVDLDPDIHVLVNCSDKAVDVHSHTIISIALNSFQFVILLRAWAQKRLIRVLSGGKCAISWLSQAWRPGDYTFEKMMATHPSLKTCIGCVGLRLLQKGSCVNGNDVTAVIIASKWLWIWRCSVPIPSSARPQNVSVPTLLYSCPLWWREWQEYWFNGTLISRVPVVMTNNGPVGSRKERFETRRCIWKKKGREGRIILLGEWCGKKFLGNTRNSLN